MAIEIRCDNIAGYDQASQSYAVCNYKIKVRTDQVGKRVMCPKCQQPLLVRQVTNPVEKRASSSRHEIEPIATANAGDVMAMDFQGAQKLATASRFQVEQRCPKCGGVFSERGICQTCGYVEPVQAAERLHKTKKRDRPAGFQLWLRKSANEGVSIDQIGWGMFILSVVFCVIVIFWGILSTSIIGAIFATLFAFVLVFVCLVFQATRRIAGDNNASLGVLGPLWEATLFLARLNDWQQYDPQLKGRKIIDLRKRPIDDGQLVMLEGLNDCEVLDLQHSSISDNGLQALFSLPNLRCLVLKNTDVSREAVTKLQQHRPVLWIWV